jgi:hypothetical protein
LVFWRQDAKKPITIDRGVRSATGEKGVLVPTAYLLLLTGATRSPAKQAHQPAAAWNSPFFDIRFLAFQRQKTNVT